jgi:hypothetical protein
MILDGIVSAPRQLARQHSPLVAYLCMQHHQLLILLVCPFAAVDVGVEMVVPPAASSTRETQMQRLLCAQDFRHDRMRLHFSAEVGCHEHESMAAQQQHLRWW